MLVIDDDRMSQMLLSRNLRQAGYEVQAASSGREGLDKMRAQPFDLVILDFVMPEMDGYEVLGEITNDERLRSVPVVVVSGVDDVSNAATLVEAGAADYLTKPVDSGLLRARASRCIDTKRMRDREQRLYAEIEAGYARLRELERLRDSLTHMIVHDLRTPLTSLLSSVKTVAQLGDSLPPDRRARLLALASRGGDALVEMINDLLDVHKLEGGHGILHRASGDLAPVLRRAAEQVEGVAEEAGVTLTVDLGGLEIAGERAALFFDAAKIERVAVNLLGNAIKATDDGGKIGLRASWQSGADGAGVRVEVSDTGSGIPAEHLEHLFEKFYRVGGTDESSDVRRGSTGLGLTFCKMTVDAHGGTLSVRSEVGVGTTFVFTLPEG